MAPAPQRRLRGLAEIVALPVLIGLILTSCGSSVINHMAGAGTAPSLGGRVPADAVVVQVGVTCIRVRRSRPRPPSSRPGARRPMQVSRRAYSTS